MATKNPYMGYPPNLPGKGYRFLKVEELTTRETQFCNSGRWYNFVLDSSIGQKINISDSRLGYNYGFYRVKI